jgi:putative FmdB family regulatory protein
MPMYEYECLTCGLHFERRQHFSDPPLRQCPHCHSKVRRVFSPPAIVFNGPGFYVTDNRSGGNGGNSGERAIPKEKARYNGRGESNGPGSGGGRASPK